MELCSHPHRRFNPLLDEWVLVSPNRMNRPWQGKTEEISPLKRPAYDARCYLCPGNTRTGGIRNPDYRETYVFTNDFAALLPDLRGDSRNYNDGLLAFRSERGVCRVVCYTPDHSLTFARMRPEKIAGVVDVWVEEYEKLAAMADIGYVQIFENRGPQMGCSNPHPHGQIWASSSVPDIPLRESRSQAAYHEAGGGCLLCDYLRRELEEGERVVLKNDHFVVLVPFWAVWPFEVILLPRRHLPSLSVLGADERLALAQALKELCVRYDNLFRTDFPYSMGIHQQPVDGGAYAGWHFHYHFYPPLLRSASVRKFMVGYELMASPQRDITAEAAAARLRELAAFHYSLEEKGKNE